MGEALCAGRCWLPCCRAAGRKQGGIRLQGRVGMQAFGFIKQASMHVAYYCMLVSSHACPTTCVLVHGICPMPIPATVQPFCCSAQMLTLCMAAAAVVCVLLLAGGAAAGCDHAEFEAE